MGCDVKGNRAYNTNASYFNVLIKVGHTCRSKIRRL